MKCGKGTMVLVGLGGAAAGALIYKAYKESQEAAVSGLGVIVNPLTFNKDSVVRMGSFYWIPATGRMESGYKFITDKSVIIYLNQKATTPNIPKIGYTVGLTSGIVYALVPTSGISRLYRLTRFGVSVTLREVYSYIRPKSYSQPELI